MSHKPQLDGFPRFVQNLTVRAAEPALSFSNGPAAELENVSRESIFDVPTTFLELAAN